MRSKREAKWGAAVLALATAPAGFGQVAGVPVAPVSTTASASTVREIDDLNTGGRWLLVRDGAHPGGPGHLVLVGTLEFGKPRTGSSQSLARQKEIGMPLDSKTMQQQATVPLPVVRTGDRLIVEEHSAVVDARLEAVALGPAAAGASLNVRLEIGGKVLRAVALEPGRAALAPETGVQP